MRKPSELEIEYEIHKLRFLADHIPGHTMFCEPWQDVINWQADVLEDCLSRESIMEKSVPEGTPIDQPLCEMWSVLFRDHVMFARNWMDGEDPDPPSFMWDAMIKNMALHGPRQHGTYMDR